MRRLFRLTFLAAAAGAIYWFVRRQLSRFSEGSELDPADLAPISKATPATMNRDEVLDISAVNGSSEVPSESAEPRWVSAESVDGPNDNFPVKAKMTSGKYYRPGNGTYLRVKADRYYASIGAAEADGLQHA